MAGVTVELDGAAHVVDSSLWRVWLQKTAGSPIAVAVDPTKKLNWSTLDQLKALSELSYDGADDGVIAYVRTRETVKHLMWTGHACSKIDVASTQLSQLGLDPSQPTFTVRTPKTLQELRIYAPKKKGPLKIAIDDPRDGSELALTLFGATPASPVSVNGVGKLGTLRFWFAREIDLAKWRMHPTLRELEIMGDPICVVKSIEHLATFGLLTTLTLRNCYELDASALPDAKKLPKLARLAVDGTTKEIADALRAKLGSVKSIEIRGIRTPAWLAANLDNPFREWADEYGASVGAAASKAWRMALEALEKKPTPAKVKAELVTFVKAFNALDKKPGLDTIQAEEISEAYDRLLERASKTLGKSAPSDENARSWFEKERSF